MSLRQILFPKEVELFSSSSGDNPHFEALSSTLHSWGQNADMLMFLLNSWLQFVKTHLTTWLFDSEETYSAETSGQLYKREKPYSNKI